MTLKAFSLEYGIPYNIVYEASYRVKTHDKWLRNREYDREELREAVADILKKRIVKHREIAKAHLEEFKRLKGDTKDAEE